MDNLQKPLNPLSKLKTVLQCSSFCGICLVTGIKMVKVDKCFVKGDWEGDVLNMREILDELFRNSASILFSEFICDLCRQQSLNCFEYIMKVRQTAQVYTEYLKILDLETKEFMSNNSSGMYSTMIVLDNYATTIAKTGITTTVPLSPSTYKCDICKRVFTLKKNYVIHLKKHEEVLEKTEYFCPVCPIVPCVHAEYITSFHDQKKTKCRQICCHECGLKFSHTLIYLIGHANKEHLNIKPEVCLECGKEFFLKSQLNMHYEYHHNNKHKCTLCFHRFKSKKHLATHFSKCKLTQKLYKCDKYPVFSETRLSKQFHMGSHLPSYATKCIKSEKKIYKRKEARHVCLTCKQSFKSKLDLGSHIRNVHEKKPNLCRYCNKQYDSREEYLRHNQTQEHKKNVPYTAYRQQCPHCNYTCSTSIMLTAHINKSHLKIKPFQCHYCENTYFDNAQLQNHIKIHMGIKSKVCDICGAHLKGPTALKKHRRLHTGERPYSCPYCEEKTNCASTLKTHIMRKHMEPTINCPLCDLKFHTMTNARGHVKKSHWKSKEKFDYRKLEGLSPKDYDFFRDRRRVVLDE